MKIGVDVYWENEHTGRLEVDGIKVIKNECYVPKTCLGIYVKYPFLNIKDGRMALECLRERVYGEDRANIDEILEFYDMKEYNWFELLKKTHGACMDDFLWFKVDGNGDENLKFDDFHGRSSVRKVKKGR